MMRKIFISLAVATSASTANLSSMFRTGLPSNIKPFFTWGIGLENDVSRDYKSITSINNTTAAVQPEQKWLTRPRLTGNLRIGGFINNNTLIAGQIHAKPASGYSSIGYLYDVSHAMLDWAVGATVGYRLQKSNIAGLLSYSYINRRALNSNSKNNTLKAHAFLLSLIGQKMRLDIDGILHSEKQDITDIQLDNNYSLSANKFELRALAEKYNLFSMEAIHGLFGIGIYTGHALPVKSHKQRLISLHLLLGAKVDLTERVFARALIDFDMMRCNQLSGSSDKSSDKSTTNYTPESSNTHVRIEIRNKIDYLGNMSSKLVDKITQGMIYSNDLINIRTQFNPKSE